MLFFEGTGQGVAGKYTNVTRLKDFCVEDAAQKLHIESGPGTHFGAYLFGKVMGSDCREILRSSRRWFQQNYESLPAAVPSSVLQECQNSSCESRDHESPGHQATTTSVYLFGFSRGALLARKFAEWLDKIGVPVAYLGVWDTVDSALKVDVGESCPECVAYARHAVARDERRRCFKLVPMLFDKLRKGRGEERVFPGVHSDVGGLYDDYHELADVTLAWIAEPAVKRGLRLKPGVSLRCDLDPETLPVHDSFRLVSNLWGLLGSSVRSFATRLLAAAFIALSLAARGAEAQDDPFTGASWIGVPGRYYFWGDRGAHPAPVFRRAFVVERTEGCALSIASGGYYHAVLNGQEVTDARLTPTPSNFDRAVHWNRYDVSSLLRIGTNELVVTLGSGFYNYTLEDNFLMSQASWRDSPQFIARIGDADGGPAVVTDASWDVHADGPVRFDAIRRGVVYDARRERLEAKGWSKAEKKHGAGGEFRRATHPPVRIVARRAMSRMATGVWDAGQNAAGVCELRVKGERGAEIVLVHREDVEADGSLHESESFQQGEFMTDHYILRGDADGETWSPRFTYHGFRYVKPIVKGKAEILGLTQLELSSDFSVVGRIECADRDVELIQRAFLASYRSNFVGYPTDCPTREKQGWSGDALAACESGLFNFDAAAGYADWLRGFADVQRPNGQIPCKSPLSANGFNWGYGPAWDEALVLIPWRIYVVSGDDSLLRELYPAIRRYRRFAHSMMTDGLAVKFGLGDWCRPADVVRGGHNNDVANATCYHYLGLCTSVRVAEMLGEKADAERWRAEADGVRRSFRKSFCRDDGGVCGNLPTDLALAVQMDLVPDAAKTAALLAQTVRSYGHRQAYGLLGSGSVPRVLMEHGYHDDAVKLLKASEYPSVLNYLRAGATTLWERFDGKGSRNHVMFGDWSAWLYRYPGGFRFDDRRPGELVVAPIFLRPLGSFMAIYRGVESAWRIDGDEVEYRLVVPEGGQVVLVLPRRAARTFGAGTHGFRVSLSDQAAKGD